ncbi:MAG: hypothetical protein AAGN46_06075 [Acidobacteriota bacterium]
MAQLTDRMPLITIGFGSILFVLGVVGYFASGQASFTALIPAAFGIVFEVLGVVARVRDGLRKHAMHAAAALALIAVLGSLRGVLAVPTLLDGTAERPAAIAAQLVMFALSAGFLGLCVQSFREARRARAA